jgi:ABC-2 type transport system ATP-binding protein
MLKVEGLTKDFGNKKGAFNINLSVEKGEIVGFIGPNGAGKSTTLNMCNGFIRPDKGQISLLGSIIEYHSIHKLLPKIGVLLSEVAFEPNLTPTQIFQETQLLFGKSFQQRYEELATYLDLDLDKPFHKLSLGNRKKVGIINCLLHNPDLIILDEPTSGLDPLIQQKVMNLFKEVATRGGGVLLSSHVLSEVQNYCNRVVMLKNGQIILESTTEQVMNQAQRLFRFRNLSEDIKQKLINSNLTSKQISNAGETLIYTTKYQEILQVLGDNNIFDFYIERPSLEETFLEYYVS